MTRYRVTCPAWTIVTTRYAVAERFAALAGVEVERVYWRAL